ncbi:hypothetical protein K7432_018675 [Basidiobolus ranarum]|uniref:Endonuclease/exonuclease/phosphatase domain-containing protein n=1 Tax=Basidiobolus ranarum TaxID=34480 RepID=A0ABR2X2H5_9FUNG
MVTTRSTKQLSVKDMFQRQKSDLKEEQVNLPPVEETKSKPTEVMEKRKRAPSEELTLPLPKQIEVETTDTLVGQDNQTIPSSPKRVKLTETEPTPTVELIACTNTTMPDTYSYKDISDNQMKIVSWNVNSLNAAMKKGFLDYVKAEKPDILCLQETKLNQTPKDILKKEYKYQYWWCCNSGKKGYAGSAVLSKIEPLNVTYGLEDTDLDDSGRVITLEFEEYYLIACYIPNAGEKLVRLKYREEWDIKMKNMLENLNAKKPVIWAGDLNVAHQEIDLARPAQNRNKYNGNLIYSLL